MQTTIDALVADGLKISFPLIRKELEQAQIERLRRTVEHARRNSVLYKKRFKNLDVDSLGGIKDLAMLPFVTSGDIANLGHQLHCVSQSEVARIITMHTSGSTGKPKRYSFTATDLAATSKFFFHGMASLVGQGDSVLVLLPYETEASVGELLISALLAGGIKAQGLWPPLAAARVTELICKNKITSVVGLPQQLLALSESVPFGQLKSMLLCSDYAPDVLRKRIEQHCGCETFLHYGATESGLGGAVECSEHCGVHIRESDLLIEIIDSRTGQQLSDGVAGEVVLTTLGREAMPLIRYRTGDWASLDKRYCKCGGVTARLCNIYGRLNSCQLSDGSVLNSQALDDILFQVSGLLDYRVTLDNKGVDRLSFEYIATSSAGEVGEKIQQIVNNIPEVSCLLESNELRLDNIQQVESFAPTHTLKRTILDLR